MYCEARDAVQKGVEEITNMLGIGVKHWSSFYPSKATKIRQL